MAAKVISRRDDAIFASVFPKTNYTTPTPEATPNIGTISSPGRPFGGFDEQDISEEAVKHTRAWSAVTRFLTLPWSLDARTKALDRETSHALALLLSSPSSQKDLVAWYTNEINVHFRNFINGQLEQWQQPITISNAVEVFQSTTKLLQRVIRHYTAHLELFFAEISDLSRLDQLRFRSRLEAFKVQILRNARTIILHAIPRQRLQKTLASVLYQHLKGSLSLEHNPEICTDDDQCHHKIDVTDLMMDELHDVGFGGSIGERAFAHAIHRFLQGPAIERRCFEVDWNGHASVVPKLRTWVQQNLAPTIEENLAALTGNDSLKLSHNDIQQFESIAVANLGRLRTSSLFDYIKSWPASSGAVLDVWEYLNAGTPADKAHVCQSFSEQVQRRLLHAGASTSEILSIYVSVIHAFKALDSRGVLLEKVAVPIRSYLRARDDTVSIIAASFLADVDPTGDATGLDMDKVCADITIEVANSTLEDSRDKRALNWDDMEWVPDPIDAGPDYKAVRSEDIVAYILGLFEQEEFIKEVTNVLAQHLLHATDHEYVKETRLVELFKSRLDATKLQAAEVMLKDMRDSVSLGKRLNPRAVYDSTTAAAPTPREIQAAIPEDGITLPSLFRFFEGRMKHSQFLAAVKLVANKRNELFFAKRTRLPPEPAGSAEKRHAGTDFKVQILSSFFWPQLRSNEFEMPEEFEPHRVAFEYKFGRLGSQRKLQWRPALGRVSLRLDLEDRTIEETDLPAWRASVIDTFASVRNSPQDKPAVQYNETLGLTKESLMRALDMEEEFVLDALNFWTSKNVLYQKLTGAYAVLERLDNDLNVMQAPQTMLPAQTISAVMSQDAMLRENAPMFEAFIASMLGNQGAKEVGGMMGITNVMKMVLPDFTYGDEEVEWLLGQMEERGEVVKNGLVWSVVQ